MTIIVAEVVIRRNRERLDTSVHKELGEDGLELRLTGLEVVASNERLVLLGEVDHTRNKRVLGRTVDERNTLQDGGNGQRWSKG